MKCYNYVFTKEGFKNNYGSFILMPIIVFHIISGIISLFREIDYIKDIISDIIKAKKVIKPRKQLKENERLLNKKEKEEKNKIPKKKKKRGRNRKKIKNEFDNDNNKSSPIKKIKKKKTKNNVINNNYNDNALGFNLVRSNPQNIEPFYLNEDNPNNKENITILENNSDLTLKLNSNELNSMSYEEAIKQDKRSFSDYYISLLKINHILFFSFYCKNNDYNSRLVKINLFFTNFSINYTVNALFFNDNTMHKIYEDGGEFNFIYQIPQIIYSSIISGILFTILKLIALSENIVLEIKNEKNIKLLKEKKKSSLRLLKIKFISFYVITFFLLMMFFYYLASFCAIYRNTQIHLIKDSLISLALSMIYPFFICLLPGLLRIPALKEKSGFREYMYNISKFLQMI